jgi:hypothetical protein
MITVGLESDDRRFDSADTTNIVDLTEYRRKAVADETRWTTGQAKASIPSLHAGPPAYPRLQLDCQRPQPAYYYESPLMRLPMEIRLEIFAYVFYDAGEIGFNFQPKGHNALFSDALSQHAIQIPSDYSKETDRPLAWYPLYWFGRDPRLAPQWKNQIFVEMREFASPVLKRSDARRTHLRFTQKKCRHGHHSCSWCQYRLPERTPSRRADGRVLRVCKGIYYEALPLLYKLNVFAFENAYEMGAVLHRMGPGRAFIQYVDVRSPLFHGGILWDYLVPCGIIRRIYFPESSTYTMFQGGKRVADSIDQALDFFSGWIIRGGQTFFDMVRNRERGATDPLSLLTFHGGSNNAEEGRKLEDGVRLWLQVDNRKPRSPKGTDPPVSTVGPVRLEVSAVADW